MLTFSAGRARVSVSFYAVAAAAAFLMLDKSGFAPAVLAAAALHEGGHLLCLRLLRVPVAEAALTLSGLRIRARGERMSRAAALLTAGAGCAANLLAAMLFAMAHSADGVLLSAANAALGLLNLLPLSGSDGGTLCRTLLASALGAQRGNAAAEWISRAAALLLAAAALLAAARRGLWLWGVLALLLIGARLFPREVE